MSTRKHVLLLGAALSALAAGRARAELIELTNGHVMQGKVVDGQTSDDGLALELFDTNGVVIVKWDHIIESRRKALRQEHGIDVPEESVEYVDGHRVLLNSNQYAEGVAENPRELSAPLRLKTRTGVKEYDRSMLAGKVEDAKIDGLLVYTVEELYQKILDEGRPETSAAHKMLAVRCMNIGAFEHAKEHLNACKADTAFIETLEGKAVEGMLQKVEVLIRAKGAQDLKTQVGIAGHDNRWNDALKLVGQIDEQYKDDVIRQAIGFDMLEARTVKGRDTYFQRAVALDVFRVLENLLEAKAREKPPLRTGTDVPPASGTAGVGTLAAARQWSNRELAAQLWDKVAADTGLKKEELEKYWTTRTVKQVRKANYGSGSFIVVKKAAAGPKGPGEPPRRRPPGQGNNNKGNKNVPDKAKAPDKPLTEEEWWEKVGPSDRTRWLTANFVETGGYFEVLRTDQVPCQGCGGLGFNKSTASNGDEEKSVCVQCNTCGVVKTVSYR